MSVSSNATGTLFEGVCSIKTTSSQTGLPGDNDSDVCDFCAGDCEEDEVVKNLVMEPLSGENLAGVL